MNQDIRNLMDKHKLPFATKTIYGLEIERIAEEYAEKAFKAAREVEKECDIWNCSGNVRKYTTYEQFKKDGNEKR